VVQGGLVGRLVKVFGEKKLVVAGTLIAALAVGSVPYPSGMAGLLAVLAALALGQGLAAPSLSSLTSKLVRPDEVGGVMGIYQAFSSLARIFGPLVAELSYHIGYHWPFRVAAIAYFLAFGVSTVLFRRVVSDA
jgi:MFS family permease